MKKLLIGIAIFCTVFAALYLGSPYYAVHNFVSIAKSGDVDRIDAAVDFPRVRDSLKAQFNAELAENMATDPALKGNPFGGISMMMAPAMVDRMVDAVVTPEGIAAMVRSGKMEKKEAQPAPSKPDVKVATSYVTLDRFKAVITNEAGTAAPITMTFERRGLFGWRLIRLQLPLPAERARDSNIRP